MPAQGPQKQGSKGNPASTRMGSQARKARYERNWKAQQKRKTERRERNAAAAKNNAKLDTFHKAWELARWKRSKTRADLQAAYAEDGKDAVTALKKAKAEKAERDGS